MEDGEGKKSIFSRIRTRIFQFRIVSFAFKLYICRVSSGHGTLLRATRIRVLTRTTVFDLFLDLFLDLFCDLFFDVLFDILLDRFRVVFQLLLVRRPPRLLFFPWTLVERFDIEPFADFSSK